MRKHFSSLIAIDCETIGSTNPRDRGKRGELLPVDRETIESSACTLGYLNCGEFKCLCRGHHGSVTSCSNSGEKAACSDLFSRSFSYRTYKWWKPRLRFRSAPRKSITWI